MRDLNLYNFKRALPRMVYYHFIRSQYDIAHFFVSVELDAGEPL
jgi:hypothetical protein